MWKRSKTRSQELRLSPQAEVYAQEIMRRVEEGRAPFRPDPYWVRAHAGAIEIDEQHGATIWRALTSPEEGFTTSWIVTGARIYVARYDPLRLVAGYTVALTHCVNAFSWWDTVTVTAPGHIEYISNLGSEDVALDAKNVIEHLIRENALPRSDRPLLCLPGFTADHVDDLYPIVEGTALTVTAYRGRVSIQSAAGEASLDMEEIDSITAQEGVLHISAGERGLVCTTDLPGSSPADLLNEALLGRDGT